MLPAGKISNDALEDAVISQTPSIVPLDTEKIGCFSRTPDVPDVDEFILYEIRNPRNTPQCRQPVRYGRGRPAAEAHRAPESFENDVFEFGCQLGLGEIFVMRQSSVLGIAIRILAMLLPSGSDG